MNMPEWAIEKAAEDAHAAICEEKWTDCSDADWGYGKCWKAARAALTAAAPLLMAQAWDEGKLRGKEIAAWALGTASQGTRPDEFNPYRKEQP